jgi:hypothetical protein
MMAKTYTHMLDRMKKDLIAIKIGTNNQNISLKSKSLIKDSEVDKQRKAKEQKL